MVGSGGWACMGVLIAHAPMASKREGWGRKGLLHAIGQSLESQGARCTCSGEQRCPEQSLESQDAECTCNRRLRRLGQSLESQDARCACSDLTQACMAAGCLPAAIRDGRLTVLARGRGRGQLLGKPRCPGQSLESQGAHLVEALMQEAAPWRLMSSSTRVVRKGGADKKGQQQRDHH